MGFRHTWAHFVSGIGSTIMGIALMIGMLVTPYAEDAFACLGENTGLRFSFFRSSWAAKQLILLLTSGNLLGKKNTPGHFLVSFEVRPTFPKHFVLTLNCEMTGSPTFKNCSGSFLQLGKSGSAPRYLKEHVAVALGIIAVLVVAIVALSKSFGPENLQRKRKEQILK